MGDCGHGLRWQRWRTAHRGSPTSTPVCCSWLGLQSLWSTESPGALVGHADSKGALPDSLGQAAGVGPWKLHSDKLRSVWSSCSMIYSWRKASGEGPCLPCIFYNSLPRHTPHNSPKFPLGPTNVLRTEGFRGQAVLLPPTA